MLLALTLLLASVQAVWNGSGDEILNLTALDYHVGPDTCDTWKNYDCFNCILSNCNYDPAKMKCTPNGATKGITIAQFLDRAPICKDLG